MFILKSESGDPLYIVYPAEVSSHEFEAVETLFNRIRALTGARPVLTCKSDLPDGVPAILVGHTTYPETRDALENLNFGEGVVKATGSRLVVATRIDSLLPDMVSYILDNMAQEPDGTLIIRPDDCRFTDNRYLRFLPAYEGGKLIAYRGGCDGCDMVVIGDTDENQYREYLDRLTSAGFVRVWEREAHGNLFACFKNEITAIRAYFTPCNKFTRILIEPVANLFVPDTVAAAPTVQPALTFMGRRFSYTTRYLERDSGAGQMSFVLRLSDGSFIIIDGGLPTDAFADGIWDALVAQAPDPGNITVAAWIITHSHTDHIGGFVKFAEKYSRLVRLERVIFNFPAIKDAEVFREARNIRITKEALYTHFPEAIFSKPHTGDMLKIRDAEIEVLYTHEDFVSKNTSLLNTKIYNEASMVMRITLGGSRIMFMADAQDGANKIICDMYGAYLKSDILQVCHHGGVGGTIPLYEEIDPEVAIFSTTDELLPVYLGIRYNYHLVYEQNVKQIFNSAENTITLPLPYAAEYRNIPPFNGTIVEKVRGS